MSYPCPSVAGRSETPRDRGGSRGPGHSSALASGVERRRQSLPRASGREPGNSGRTPRAGRRRRRHHATTLVPGEDFRRRHFRQGPDGGLEFRACRLEAGGSGRPEGRRRFRRTEAGRSAYDRGPRGKDLRRRLAGPDRGAVRRLGGGIFRRRAGALGSAARQGRLRGLAGRSHARPDAGDRWTARVRAPRIGGARDRHRRHRPRRRQARPRRSGHGNLLPPDAHDTGRLGAVCPLQALASRGRRRLGSDA